jgi:beta-glucanase (GH16 family)
MKMSSYNRITMVSIILSLFLVFCDKNENPPDTQDPANLVVTIISVDNQTGNVALQAMADNAVQYQLLIGNADTADQVNETGYFEYNFGTVEGQYDLTVRAYGESGKYIKVTKSVTIIPEPQGPVPLDSGYYSPASYDGYALAWQDEFNGTSVDLSNWTFEVGGNWYNNELQFYKADNATVGDGVLTIEARNETYGGRNYTSARMITQNKRMFMYGRIDIRALLPKGQGLWPALWMLGQDVGTTGWPGCGEIDIMEMIGGSGREDQVYGTLHWDDGSGQADYGGSYVSLKETFYEKYHVFSMLWDANQIKIYVDNYAYFTCDITPASMSEFRQEQFFIFNVAVGGTWPGNPDASTVFPQSMKVDYVRVFQKQ